MKFSVKDITKLGMFMAITIILGYINKMIPEMPQGGTISIDVIAILLCSYLMGWQYGVICGCGASLLQFALGLALYYGPWSVILDYVLPLSVLGLAPLLKNIDYQGFILMPGIFFSFILKYISHFLSGAFLFAEYAPEGMNPLFYSFVYNLWYNLATMVLCFAVVPLLYKKLKVAFR